MTKIQILTAKILSKLNRNNHSGHSWIVSNTIHILVATVAQLINPVFPFELNMKVVQCNTQIIK